LALETVEALADEPRVLGVKDSWAAVEGTHSAMIEGLLRKHGLLPTLARA
jgi:hypothetical protein